MARAEVHAVERPISPADVLAIVSTSTGGRAARSRDAAVAAARDHRMIVHPHPPLPASFPPSPPAAIGGFLHSPPDRAIALDGHVRIDADPFDCRASIVVAAAVVPIPPLAPPMMSTSPKTEVVVVVVVSAVSAV
jgi:hypothetical protein